MARSMGDNTAQDLGRLTLNPLKHLDMFGSILLPLMLLIVGSPVMFGYAKPVPYNPNNLSDRKFGPAKVALAGPLSNLFLAVLFGLTLRFLSNVFPSSFAPELFAYIIGVNLFLAVFNLVPIPPLDGHWLLMAVLPPQFVRLRVFLYRYSLPLLFLFIFFGFSFLIPIVNFLFKLIVGI